MCGGMCAGMINSGRKPVKKEDAKSKEEEKPEPDPREWELGGP